MGRRQSKHQPPYSSPTRRPDQAGWDSDAPEPEQPQAIPVMPKDKSEADYSGAESWDDGAMPFEGDTEDEDALPRRVASQQTDTSLSSNDPRELELRELAIAVREADLQARRREAAREIRRIRKQTPRVEARLGDIELLIAELAQAVLQLGHANHSTDTQASSPGEPLDPADRDALVSEMRGEIESLKHDLDSLRRQNEELAGELAQSAIRRSINKSSDAEPTLSWEQRKALLFSQDQDTPSTIDPDSIDVTIRHEFVRLQQELDARDEEVAQLRDLLEQRPTQCEDGMAVGAAAIAQMMDGDELIREERQRLLDLQTEWESKFRQMEISASIERANLARERQQLERQNAELEEQLAHLKRELKQEEITGPNQPRRWFAKLGLAD